jgi:hypothetical protein
MGEHGFIGLLIFILFLVFAWRAGSRIIRACKGRADLKWASNLAAMCQVSLIGYMVGGAFLTLAYYDLAYYIIALLVVLERLLMPKGKIQPLPASEPATEAPVRLRKQR